MDLVPGHSADKYVRGYSVALQLTPLCGRIFRECSGLNVSVM